MEVFYAFFISFFIVFCSEIGDKTQLLVLSFSAKSKTSSILLGVALGTFLSHGLAIIFGSQIGSLNNENFRFYLDIFTYSTFLLFGVWGFIPKKEKEDSTKKTSFIQSISNLKINYLFIVAISIIIGELGDKTFLASLGLGLQYPNFKFALILGSISGMVLSNLVAIIFGKLVSKRLNTSAIEFISNLLFVLFGLIGFFSIIFR